MLTIQALCVLFGLKKLTDNTDAPFSRTMSSPDFTVLGGEKTYKYPNYVDEIESILKLLEDEKLIQREDTWHTLTQDGIHFIQREVYRLLGFIVDNLVSIAALVVSIIALCKSVASGR